MKTFWRIIQFLQYVHAAWRMSFSDQPQPDPEATTSAEAEDEAAWNAAKAEYERQMREQSDSEFWAPEEEKK